MDDRLMTVKQVAEYLSVNERTALKLVAEGKLPGVKVGNQWRFRKAMIDTWLDDQALGVTPRYVEKSAPKPEALSLELRACFEPSQIITELSSTTKTAVIEELAGHAAKLGLIRDKTWMVGALIERENLMPSGIGAGWAVLHTAQRAPEVVVRPFMVLGRSTAGVDFDALDGQPTHLFFLLGLRYQALHLPWLSKLTQMLAQPRAVKRVLAANGARGIFAALTESEKKLEAR